MDSNYPLIKTAIAITETDERIVAVHLFVIAVRSALRDAVEAFAGQVQRTAGTPGDTVNDRRSSRERRVVWIVNINLAGLIRIEHGAVGQAEHRRLVSRNGTLSQITGGTVLPRVGIGHRTTSEEAY